MINIENDYIGLLAGVLNGGKSKDDRTGTGTKAVFGRMIYHDMKNSTTTHADAVEKVKDKWPKDNSGPK